MPAREIEYFPKVEQEPLGLLGIVAVRLQFSDDVFLVRHLLLGLAHVTQRQFVHSHRWRPNEMVMWDNRCTMHRGTDFDDLRWVRDMRRVTLSDVANTCEQAGVAPPRAEAAA